MTGIDFIISERNRQIEKEGFNRDHDDEHQTSELALAAAAYALPEWIREARVRAMSSDTEISIRAKVWPWEDKWWKPSPENRIRELAKAGALIVAEIDRLNRIKEKSK